MALPLPEPSEEASEGVTHPCPNCGDAAHLAIMRIPGTVPRADPFRWCYVCHGVWGKGSALGRSMPSNRSLHPALAAELADVRRSCPPLCPECAVPMSPFELGGRTLDACSQCSGIWFDSGELAAVYGLPEQPRRFSDSGWFGGDYDPDSTGFDAFDLDFGDVF